MKSSTALCSLFATLACAAVAPFSPSSPRPFAGRVLDSRKDNSTEQWPYGPFKTEGRDILNARGEKITWAGVNWPMSGETMIPEGLEYKSASEILDMAKSVGFNFIRMGYAIQMVDEIYARNGTDVSLQESLIAGLGTENGTRVASSMVAANPGWTLQTTRFEIWSTIAELAQEKGIFIHPDNHISTAEWCCSHEDGNAWFDDTYFNVSKWQRGLAYVAKWAAKHPAVVSMSLRNELRTSWNNTGLVYDWLTYVGNMTAGADAIHAANPDLLISWSGMQFDEDLSALTGGRNLLTAPCYKCDAVRDAHRRDPVYFDLGAHPWADKVVYELHLYAMSEDLDTGTCDVVQANLYRAGFHALGIPPPAAGCQVLSSADAPASETCPPARRLTPVMLSEFGAAQDGSLYDDVLQNCLRDFTLAHDVSWMVWALAGSYRVREGTQGFVDTWGLTNADWSGWSDEDTIDGFWKPWTEGMNATSKA
ncbi:glycoside hydrolase family 5 protein [Xylariomycetidae sp. FL0641]|nr:glycoside hydrolase family 5 protein [Xylariomycetidae sp. FL0641]